MKSLLKMPKLGETVDVVIVIEWMVAAGDVIGRGDPLITVETDKVETQVEAVINGTVVELLVAVGDEVQTGQAFAVVEA